MPTLRVLRKGWSKKNFVTLKNISPSRSPWRPPAMEGPGISTCAESFEAALRSVVLFCP